MKSRHPTPEERKLWRESNRFTQRVREPAGEEETGAAASQPSPNLPSVKQKAGVTIANRDSNKTQVSPLAPLPTRDAAKRFKAYAEIEATLDLHGYGKEDAYAAVHRFLARAQKQGKRHVAIITGKGRVRESVLKRELPHWLNEPGNRALISAFAPAPPEKGGAGVTHVLIKKRRD